MNIENIKAGMKFTTTTKLYKALDLPNVRGNQKIAQDKEIARYIDYAPTGTNNRAKGEIVVTEVRTTPLDKVDGRVNNGDNKYIDDLVLLLENYISRVNTQEITSSKLLISLEIVNDEYLNIFNDYNKLAERMTEKINIKITSKTLEDFYKNINRTMNSALKCALSKLHRSGKIDYAEKTYMLNIGDRYAHEADEHELKIIKDNEVFVLETLYEEGVISKASQNYIHTFKQRRKYNKLLEKCYAEDDIKLVWKMIWFKNLQCSVIDQNEVLESGKVLRNKFANTVEERMRNIKFLPDYLRDKNISDLKSISKGMFIKPYSEYHSDHGYVRMKETIKFMYMKDLDLDESDLLPF